MSKRTEKCQFEGCDAVHCSGQDNYCKIAAIIYALSEVIRQDPVFRDSLINLINNQIGVAKKCHCQHQEAVRAAVKAVQEEFDYNYKIDQ